MKDQFRVLHLSASDHGGAYLFAENLVRNFQHPHFYLKHYVYTGTAQNIKITGLGFLDRLIKFMLHALEKVIFSLYEKDKSIRFKFSLGYPGIPFFILKRLCKNYDLIHLHWINKGFIHVKHLGKINKPIVWTCHDIWPVTGGCHLTFGCENYKANCGNCPFLKYAKEKDLSNKLLTKKKSIYRHLNLTFVSPSKWMLCNTQASQVGKGHAHILINNGVDTNIFNYRNQSRTIGKFTIGFVAANLNDENKALYRLAEAIALLDKKHEYKLLLIGQQKREFEFEIDIEYEILQNIDTAHKMAELYQLMDLLVVTSTLETFPTALMEASCCGVNCLGFDVGGIREIIDIIGEKVIAPFHIQQMSDSISSIKENGYDKVNTSQKSIKAFGISKTVNSYQNLYEELLNN